MLSDLSSYEVYVLASRRIEDRTDREPVTGTSLEDLDPRSVDRLLTELRSSSSHILDHIAENDREAALRRLNVLTSRPFAATRGAGRAAPRWR